MTSRKPISQDAFRRLVRKLSAEQLLEFPTAYLPSSIPLDAADPSTNPEKWAAIERLVWAATERDMSALVEDHVRHGEVFSRAIGVCEAETANGAEELCRLCDQLSDHCRDHDPTRDQLSEENQVLERARARAGSIMERIGRLTGALATIDRESAGEPSLRDRADAARRHARKVLSHLESALGRFHVLELDITCNAMRVKEAECELQRRRIREIDQRIEAIQAQLNRGSAVRLLRPSVARQQREAKEARLRSLRRSRESTEIYVDEDQLLRWLEVLVNTSLFADQAIWQQRARNVRLLLYRLLNTYCLQQELAAGQVLTRAIPGVNGREAIQYYLKSEEFILRYFARKQREVTQWLAGAAESKLVQLEHTRDALLAEYRRLLEARDPVVDPMTAAASA